MLDQMQIGMALDPELLDPPDVDRARAAIGAVHRISLGKQQLGQVRAVLPGNASNNRSFHSCSKVRNWSET